jgi:hypothetical protein
MSSLELVLCLFALALGGFLMGLAVGRTRTHKPHAPSPYRPVRHAYPVDYQMRRRMVIKDITSGKLGVEEAKQYLYDYTLSEDDYRYALISRKQLADLDAWTKWAEQYPNPVKMPEPDKFYG